MKRVLLTVFLTELKMNNYFSKSIHLNLLDTKNEHT
jgi:hypothetical protein